MPAKRDKRTIMSRPAILVGTVALYLAALSGVESFGIDDPEEDQFEDHTKLPVSPMDTPGDGTCTSLPAERLGTQGRVYLAWYLANSIYTEVFQDPDFTDFCQESVNDFDDNGHFERAFTFHKTLPHDHYGQVDPDAYELLAECAKTGESEKCKIVPAGDYDGSLVNPTAGVPMSLGRLERFGMGAKIKPPPSPLSAEMAAQIAECYWMSLVRDIPFSKYHRHPLTRKAAENLAYMPGFFDTNYVPSSGHKYIDPRKDLFRATFVGVRNGPMISQLLLRDYDMDAMRIRPKRKTFAAGIDYMTDHHSWLDVQNGAKPDSPEKHDPQPRYIRNGRDLGKLVYTDTIYTEAIEGAFTLMQAHAIDRGGHNGLYTKNSRQMGFVDWGVSHLMRIIGTATDVHREAWFQKWQVHRVMRPEAFAGLVHDTVLGYHKYPIHYSLLKNWELLDRVAKANVDQNRRNGIYGKKQVTFLLSQAVKEGSPAHPAYPSGHAVLYGALATVLKAMVGVERGKHCFPDPVYPSYDGFKLKRFRPSKHDWCFDKHGNERQGLTFEGEINKLATNIAFGRQMMGVHYRMDGTEGIIFGETLAIRSLHKDIKDMYDDSFFELRLFTGEVVKLKKDGFSIDEKECNIERFRGASECQKDFPPPKP